MLILGLGLKVLLLLLSAARQLEIRRESVRERNFMCGRWMDVKLYSRVIYPIWSSEMLNYVHTVLYCEVKKASQFIQN